MGLLLTPEETAPPAEIVALGRAREDIVGLVSAAGAVLPSPVPPPPLPPPVRPQPAYYPQRKSG
jgi:hypothetical protein